MSELVCKIGDSPQKDGYKDGDIIEAFNEKRILSAQAETILNPWDHDKNGDGYLDINSSPHKMYSKIKQYRFEYVVDKVFRYDQFDGDKQEDVTKDFGSIKIFLERRKHVWLGPGRRGIPLFGTPILPVWFGGKTSWDNLDNVWSDIETDKGLLKNDHKKWPLTSQELRIFLAIPCEDMTEEEIADLKSEEYEDPKAESLVITKKRVKKVPLDNMPLISDPTKANIADLKIEVDLRKHTPYKLADIVEVKK